MRILPEGMDAIVLPGGLYLNVHYKGLPANAGATFQYIFETWLPSSDYDLDNRPLFEILGAKFNRDSIGSEEQIYIPIKPKVKNVIK